MAKTMRKEIATEAKSIHELKKKDPFKDTIEHELSDKSEANKLAKEIILADARETMLLGCELQLMYLECARETGLIQSYKQTFFITIRPDQSKITFPEFLSEMKNLYKRKCFNKYILTFEQKGTSEETLGEGFHCHVIATVTQRSKGELLRDITSSCKHFCAPNCIDVKPLRTEKDMENVRDYMIEYKSDDDHKIVTQEWDTLWRNKNNLKHIYEDTSDIHVPAIKSSGQAKLTWE